MKRLILAALFLLTIFALTKSFVAAIESGSLAGRPDLVAGHSLGEYAALIAVNAVPFEDGVRLVRERGRLMLARALARRANLMVLDEPTNDLDAETLELLEDLRLHQQVEPVGEVHRALRVHPGAGRQDDHLQVVGGGAGDPLGHPGDGCRRRPCDL